MRGGKYYRQRPSLLLGFRADPRGGVPPACRGDVTSAQYCCLVSESICANPPSTSAFIRDLCTELDSRWSGGLRLANCFARFHQLSHCTTMFALDRGQLVSDKSII